MSRWQFYFVLAALVAANLVYPFTQAIANGGVVYYMNGNDESIYLQVDFARAASSVMRPGEILVVLLHGLGLSGGWQNVLFDLLTPLLLAAGAFVLFRRIGWQPAAARLAAIGMLAVPVAASGGNPLLHSLAYRSFTWGSFRWLNMVDMAYSPFMRTPEPQLSWLIVVAGLLLALRLRSVLPVLAVTPFTYTFVGIPVAFVAASWELHRRWGDRPYSWAGPLLATWLAIGAASGAYFGFLASPTLKILLAETHLPLVSLSSVMALTLYGLLRERFRPDLRFLALAIALAPLAASNQQVLSGMQAQPFNFEMFAGTLAVAAVLALGGSALPRAYPALVALACVFWCWNAGGNFRENAATNAIVPFDAALGQALREDARSVAVNEPFLAAILAQAYPNQPMTALDWYQGTPAIAKQHVARYRCVRAQVKRDFPADDGFFGTLLFNDRMFNFGGQDYLQLSAGRMHPPIFLHDVEKPCEQGLDRPLRYFRGRRAN